MSFLSQIDVVVLSWNEAPNIGRTLAALTRFPRVLVLDSGSTDGTVEIARGFANVRVAHRPFDQHAAQWNHALDLLGPDARWVLALDADYVLSARNVDEIEGLRPDAVGYRAHFVYRLAGHALRGSLYPPVTILFRRAGAHYRQDGHTQRLVPAPGPVLDLRAPVDHDDRKPTERWLSSQLRYARLESAHLLAHQWGELGWRDRLRRCVLITPWLVPMVVLLRGGIMDGRVGLLYALQRGIAEALLSLCLVEAALGRVKADRGGDHPHD